MKKSYRLNFVSTLIYFTIIVLLTNCNPEIKVSREIIDFNKNWQFHLGDLQNTDSDLTNWRGLNLPHDWSIEGEFSENNPAGTGGGALPGGIGWYKKYFQLDKSDSAKNIFIEFDGIYQNSEVWINGHYLGKRPNGYISFSYDMSPYLNFDQKNTILVRVDNSQQPNSRWYTGSGIYRNVRMVKTDKIHIPQWGTHIITQINEDGTAEVKVDITIKNNYGSSQDISVITSIFGENDNNISEKESLIISPSDTLTTIRQILVIKDPKLWSIKNPNLYKAITTITLDNKQIDDYSTTFGIRTFEFNQKKGFILNGERTKIKGVCNHHDLGALGAAVNYRAIERQLEILKEMGVNGIRTAHNPPAPELLDLCDKMGFIVMDESFDVWKKKKSTYDYALHWDEWHEKDLTDFVKRDRNHPSVFIWSIGNEVLEQWDEEDSSGIKITKELASIVKKLDSTRPVTAACNGVNPSNPLLKSGALDLIGFNYNHNVYETFFENFPNDKLIATETESSLHTRGHYDMPSDSIRRWPIRWDLPFLTGNKDNTCSAYDNCSTPWGSTHEETWKLVKKLDHVSGMFTWTGFDYLGEPTPYGWPSKSSYFGIIDMAGFPKDAYYLYQSEWTDKDVLHIFPHWNWEEEMKVDVWAYTNCDEVELFLNNQSLGRLAKTEDLLHLQWNVNFEPGILKAIGYRNGKQILIKEVNTSSEPKRILLEPDRNIIKADGKDLTFVTIKIVDENNNLVPMADNEVYFELTGKGQIVGVDNGNQTSLESFKQNHRKAFNGLCMVIIQTKEEAGDISLIASSAGLESARINIKTK